MRACDSYEQVTTYLIGHFAEDLGLSRVEGKQELVGLKSGTIWEIDAGGIRESDGAIVIVECRRRTTSKAKQEEMGGLVTRIIDTAAGGGIYVSPRGMQKGAKKVAAAWNILDVQLASESTIQDYAMRLQNKVFTGVSASMAFGCHASCVLVPAKDAAAAPPTEGADPPPTPCG